MWKSNLSNGVVSNWVPLLRIMDTLLTLDCVSMAASLVN